MLRNTLLALVVLSFAACSDGGGSNSSQSVPSQPSNPVRPVVNVNAAVVDDFELQVGDVTANQQAVVPVSLHGLTGTKAAGLQFDVTFSEEGLTIQNIERGSALVAADKTLQWSIIAPGRARVVVFGLNENEVSDGVVANVTVDVKSRLKPQQSLGLVNVEGAAKEVNATKGILNGKVKAGTITIQ